MKKVFILALFMCCFICSANAETILPPQWSEFCPKDYLSATVENSSYLGASSERKYWANRRSEFENLLRICSTTDNLEGCYNQVRQAEINKNENYYRDKNTSYTTYTTYSSFPSAFTTYEVYTPSVFVDTFHPIGHHHRPPHHKPPHHRPPAMHKHHSGFSVGVHAGGHGNRGGVSMRIGF